jgi:DNA-binding NarL/FixJ family response regulator
MGEGAGQHVEGQRHRIVDDDDPAFMRLELVSVLSYRSDLEVVGEASDGSAVLNLCRRLRFDLVLIDKRCRKWTASRRRTRLKDVFPTTSVLVLTAHDDT